MSRFARPLLALVVAAGLGVLLAGGCGLRTPEGIRVDQRSVDTAADDPDIRKLPPGPAPGATPAQIVRGFLEAAAADPEHLIAQNFLAGAAVWTDRDAVTIYDPESLSLPAVTTKGPRGVVRISAQGLGQVASGGAFLPAAKPVTVAYQLRKTDRQWRLSYVPPGVLLTPRDLARGYRPVRTYNFTADRSLLVSEPGYVISNRAGLAGAALHALLTNWGGQSGTSIDPFRGLAPGLTALGSVVVRDGEATVDLGREAFSVPQARRHLLVSQIAASLGSVPGVFTVRVLVEERQYLTGAVPATIPSELAPASHGPALGIAPNGALLELATPLPSTGPRAAATGTLLRWVVGRGAAARTGVPAQGGLIDPVAAPGGDRLAAWRLDAGGEHLVVADVTGSTQLTATERTGGVVVSSAVGTRYLAPQWLDRDRLLVVSLHANTPRVQLVDVAAGRTVTVPVPGLAALGPLTSFVLSRDRTRVIAVAGPAGARVAYLGRIAQLSSEPAGKPGLSIAGWAPVATSMRDVEAVSWSGDLSIAVLGQPVAASQATRLAAAVVALDTVADPSPLPALPGEFSASSRSPGSPPATVTTAAGRPTLIGLGSRSWQLRADRWLDLAPAVPAAAGSTLPPGTTAISTVSYP